MGKKSGGVISKGVQAMANVAKSLGSVAKPKGSPWSSSGRSGKGPGSKSGR